MVYNDFQGLKLSALGFGCMRLPLKEGTQDQRDGEVDIELAEKMFDYAISHGVNYFDTAWMYHGGQSEVIVGNILKKYPRDSFYLASKFPGFERDLISDPAKVFEKQLEKCQVDYFDFYLFHNVSEMTFGNYTDESLGILDYLLEQKRNGRIRHLGFSAHASLETMQQFWDYCKGEIEFCQIQLNYLDWTYQQAKEKVDMITSWGIPVWVMEPVRGGKLASLPEDMEAVLKAARPGESIPSWAFSFLQSIPAVKMVLSGMSSMEQVQENIETFSNPRPLSESERELLLKAVDEMLAKFTVPCTACRYCTSHCPMSLDIPHLISAYNEGMVSGKGEFQMTMAAHHLSEDQQPSNCIGCGSCASVCPQQIQIPDVMSAFADAMAKAPRHGR